ncbi:MAG: hypothetical protein KKD44_02850 [Proteobacteria bacterium]|nr:hypothetical protein [Pseudomonadota bacterium]
MKIRLKTMGKAMSSRWGYPVGRTGGQNRVFHSRITIIASEVPRNKRESLNGSSEWVNTPVDNYEYKITHIISE